MGFWSIMNYVAWGLCALLTVLIVTDFIRVEKERAKEENDESYFMER